MGWWDEVLRAASPIVQAVAIAVTAIFAVKSLNAWRAQLVGKRRFEVAEQVITAVYAVREALGHMRRSYYMYEDARDRPRPDGESESQARERDACFIIGKRFNDASEKFVELSKARLLCKIYFGTMAVNHVDEIFNVRNKIYTSLQIAINYAGSTVPKGAKTFKRILSAISEADDHTDNLSTQIASAIAKIEEICAPHFGRADAPMNIHRGFFRLWLLISVVWEAAVLAAVAYDLFRARHYNDWIQDWYLVATAILAPVGALGLGAALCWVARGFKAGSRGEGK